MHARQHPTRHEGATTLVWIDSEEAIIVRWADRATVERVRSDVPGRRRTLRARPSGIPPSRRRVGGGADGDGAGAARGACAASWTRWPPGSRREDDVTVVGPGVLRGRLERTLRAEDRHHGRHRLVHSAAAERLTEEELVAHVRALAGDAAPRVAPWRSPGAGPASTHAGFAEGMTGPRRGDISALAPPRGTRTILGPGGATHGHVRTARRCPTPASVRAAPRRSDRSSSRTSDARAAACASTSASPARWPSMRPRERDGPPPRRSSCTRRRAPAAPSAPGCARTPRSPSSPAPGRPDPRWPSSPIPREPIAPTSSPRRQGPAARRPPPRTAS